MKFLEENNRDMGVKMFVIAVYTNSNNEIVRTL